MRGRGGKTLDLTLEGVEDRLEGHRLDLSKVEMLHGFETSVVFKSHINVMYISF